MTTMSSVHDLLEQLRVEPGSAPQLDHRDPGARVGAEGKREGVERIAYLVERLGELHNRLYAESTRSVLLVLQGTDASGKDGTIRTVFTGVNPQGAAFSRSRRRRSPSWHTTTSGASMASAPPAVRS
jgi:polyphosphate kinase 2 (PPK2 family)